MGRAKFSSKIFSVFLRILLIASWILLVCSFIVSALLTIWPNMTVNAEEIDQPIFGVWKISKGQITTELSWLGILVICLASIAILFSLIIQLCAKKAKFKIGTRNQMIGYFSSINFPLIVFVVFAFIGTYHFNSLTEIPGVKSVQSLFLTTQGATKLLQSGSFPLSANLISSVTWVYWIFLVFSFISAIGITFTTIKLILRAIFSRTFDKKSYED